MKDEDQLYLFFRELNRLSVAGKLTHAGMEELLQPLSVLNEKNQDEYAKEMRSVIKTSADEPENSLSPAMQLALVKLLEKKAYEEECQLILSTHSPFLLAMQGARVYDLDVTPVCVKNWWELENTRLYFEFFEKHRALFL